MICPHCGKEITEVGKNEIVELYNQICVDLPKCVIVTNKRKSLIKGRGKILLDMGAWREFFEKVHRSDFLCGRTGQWRIPGIDWILNETNFTKIYEGAYDKQKPKVKEPEKPLPPETPEQAREREEKRERVAKLILGIGRKL